MKYKIGDKIKYNHINEYWPKGYFEEGGIYLITACYSRSGDSSYYNIQNILGTKEPMTFDRWIAGFIDTNTTLYKPTINQIEIV